MTGPWPAPGWPAIWPRIDAAPPPVAIVAGLTIARPVAPAAALDLVLDLVLARALAAALTMALNATPPATLNASRTIARTPPPEHRRPWPTPWTHA